MAGERRAIDELSPGMRARVIEDRKIPLRPRTREETIRKQEEVLRRLGGIPSSARKFAITRGLE